MKATRAREHSIDRHDKSRSYVIFREPTGKVIGRVHIKISRDTTYYAKVERWKPRSFRHCKCENQSVKDALQAYQKFFI